MKSLRKSLNSNGGRDSGIRAQISTPLPTVSKPPSTILPPQKVIRALSTYRPQAPQELPFHKGDFFYVLRDAELQGIYYEAHNPVSGARGLVPRSMFEEFNKGSGQTRMSQAGPTRSMPSSPVIPLTAPPQLPKTQVFYAVVLHDFIPERADELDARAGDSITVVAQSNREWFVAKPIGKLGRPGLIPVSFVEIHDPTTGKPIPDVNALMDRGDLPKVEDWKRAMYNYKQNSIALGVIDAPTPTRDSIPNSPYMPQNSIISQESIPHPQSPPTNYGTPEGAAEPVDPLPDGILLAADVVSFHHEMEEYWFRVDAIFQPYAQPGRLLPPAKQLILFRVYNDFYDFQVSLLDRFPREAGRQPPHPRLLPYMPGPAQDVDDTLTASRRSELDTYLHSLCDLGKSGGKYILESVVVREFLALKPGDVENVTEPRVADIEAIISRHSNGGSRDVDEVRDGLGRLKMHDENERSEGSDYEDEGYAPSPQRRAYDRDRHPYSQAQPVERRSNDSGLRVQAHAQNHQRTGSSSSIRAASPYAPTHSHSHSRSHSRSHSPLHPDNHIPPTQQLQQGQRTNEDYYNFPNPTSATSMRSSHATSARSPSISNINSPPISAANPQTAFVKIKIFDRVADDLIAIRVHPRVSHAELMEKVQGRLGGEVTILKYRNSVTNAFVSLSTDIDLRTWIDTTDKHVLFAD